MPRKKHENGAIFGTKMSKVRVVLGFREREARRNPWYQFNLLK